MRATFLFSLRLLPFLLPEEDCYNHNSGLGLIITNFSKHVGTRHGYKTSCRYKMLNFRIEARICFFLFSFTVNQVLSRVGSDSLGQVNQRHTNYWM